MNGAQPLGEFLRTVIKGMLEQDTDEVSLDCTIPIGGKPVLVTFDLVLTGVQPVEAAEQGDTP